VRTGGGKNPLICKNQPHQPDKQREFEEKGRFQEKKKKGAGTEGKKESERPHNKRER